MECTNCRFCRSGIDTAAGAAAVGDDQDSSGDALGGCLLLMLATRNYPAFAYPPWVAGAQGPSSIQAGSSCIGER
jgi:hypothetical protein